MLIFTGKNNSYNMDPVLIELTIYKLSSTTPSFSLLPLFTHAEVTPERNSNKYFLAWLVAGRK